MRRLVTLLPAMTISELSLYMTPQQFIVFGVVMAIYMPCLAAWAVLMKELGAKNALMVGFASITTAIIIGGAVNLVLTVI